MKKETSIVHSGRNPFINDGTVSTPVYRTSTVLFPTIKAYHEAEKGKAFYENSKGVKSLDYSYGIMGSPTSYSLQESICELEGGNHTIIVSTGLAAISVVLIGLLSSGDHLLMADSVYGPTRRLCDKTLSRMGIEVTYYDSTIGADIEKLVKDNTKVIFMENPGSLTFEVQDVKAITEVAKKHKIVTALDNSWATPIFFRPLEHGVDISIHAATKYLNGHSDVLLGTVTFNDEYFTEIFGTFRNLGLRANPDDCFLTSRGLRTLPIRLEKHQDNALKIAKWLEQRPEVAKVQHPGLESHAQHEIFKRDFDGATGLFSFILDKKYSFEALSNMIDNLKYFGIGCSWGGFESLILNIDPLSVRTASLDRWKDAGSFIRIYAGLEDVDDLIEDLEAGLERLKS